ncbi:DNA methyltransferase [Escherichia coli]|uniref:site-specific DNA-methyltransferase n=1 Tax=Escherichia coli TaxID=562 RepID=UPI000B42B8D4|nr:DNA methyltransferase [Escherichia coli]OWD11530.1 DNA methyltransferase [Escherichia coli]OWD19091.1 DNA methyltransferase [Escherichia coli]RCQ11101.1 site-specific DNA-methyltransferase [Escherichia coli]HAH2825093.1 site-specific DNA-methyltransferase [Escherichia coli]HAI0805179.1 site-specific DNA-methyltransferase [Escherichia coli]
MNKLSPEMPELQSMNITADNITKLKSLFPEAFNEDSVDFEVLKQLLGENVDDKEERYGLNWHGKRQARQLALTPSRGTLRPCKDESVDWDNTKNLMIEGDNLEVLKLLQKSYAGKVKLIYIDPPYNTGKDFVYSDNFQDNMKNYLEMTGQTEDGVRITTNAETSGRYHTDWLNMIYPRLKLAKNLLSENGIIFVSIDDIEASKLKIIMDEIFGEENFLAQFVWRTDGNFDNQAKIKNCHEYILLYAKKEINFPHPPIVDPNIPKGSKLFKPEIRNTIVKNGPKNPSSKITLPVGFPCDITSGRVNCAKNTWPIYHSDAEISDNKLTKPLVIESGWSSKELLLDFIKNNCNPIIDSKGQETSFVLSQTGTIEVVKKRSDSQSHVVSVLNGFGGTQKATAQLDEIGACFAGYPKPLDLISYIIQMIAKGDDIILDFFAGSGPTGHAVMLQNAKDRCHRKYILVQIPEALSAEKETQKTAVEYCRKNNLKHNVAELTKERLRRAGKKVREENPEWKGDVGFRVFKLDTSNIRPWEATAESLSQQLDAYISPIVEGRSEEDLLAELMLKRGIDLSVNVENQQFDGLTVSCVDGGKLFTCFAKQIPASSVEELTKGIIDWHKSLKAGKDTVCYFLDDAFENNVAKTNLCAILEQHGLTNLHSL